MMSSALLGKAPKAVQPLRAMLAEKVRHGSQQQLRKRSGAGKLVPHLHTVNDVQPPQGQRQLGKGRRGAAAAVLRAILQPYLQACRQAGVALYSPLGPGQARPCRAYVIIMH
jgi:hypothetical protein